MWISRKEFEALEERVNLAADNARDAHEALDKLRLFTDEVIVDFRTRIADIEQNYRRGSLKAEQEEEIPVATGFVPLRARKKQWEAKHSKKSEGKNG